MLPAQPTPAPAPEPVDSLRPAEPSRFEKFRAEYPKAKVLGKEADGVVPWTVIPRLDGNDYALSNEAFCGVVAFAELEAPDVVGASVTRFLEAAVTFANERCWGTLSCALLVHPDAEEASHDAFARAVRDLRYGAIGINAWPGAIYGLVSPTWGAFPGHTPDDIQSGTGVVHNAWMFDHPEKSVLRAPFRIRPTPAWFSDHKNLLELGKRLVEHEAEPSWTTLLRVARAAMKG